MISVIIPTLAGGAGPIRPFRSLAGALQGREAVEILVVRNGPGKRAAHGPVGEKGSFPVRMLELSEPGKSRAANLGAKEAGGEILAFLDDDVAVAPDFFRELEKAFSFPNLGGAGARILPDWVGKPPAWFSPGVASFTPLHDHGPDAFRYRPPESVFVGAGFAVRKTAFFRVRGLDEKLGIFGNRVVGGEEADLGLRLAKQGFGLWYWPGLRVFHPLNENLLTRACLRQRAGAQGRSTAVFLKKNRQSTARLALRKLAGARRAVRARGRAPEGAFFFELKARLYLHFLLGLLAGPGSYGKIPLGGTASRDEG